MQLWVASFILMALAMLLSSCGTVTIKNETIWALKGGHLGAFEAHTLSSASRDVSEAEWDEMAPGKLCMSIDALGDYKAIQEELCSYHPSECTYEVQEKMNQFYKRATQLHAKAVHP